jgi:alcohol dehydrogenase class IV
MAHPLGARYHIPHGVVCGLLLPYTMEYNLDAAQNKYATVASLLGEPVAGLPEREAAIRGISRVRALLREVAIPEHLASFGLQPAGFDEIIAESLPSGSLKHNPRRLAAEDVRAILQSAL